MPLYKFLSTIPYYQAEEICNNLNVSMICGNGMILSVERNEKEDE